MECEVIPLKISAMETINLTRTDFGITIPEMYRDYVNQLQERNYLEVLKEQLSTTSAFYESIPEDRLDYVYAPGKWNIREIIMHMMDAERVYSYRALRFARNDKTPLPGFEENEYVPFYNASRRTRDSLIREYRAARVSTIEFFSNLDEEALYRIGTANNNKFSVILIGACIAGHEMHHLNIIRTRYLAK
jgi:hypothetical protein